MSSSRDQRHVNSTRSDYAERLEERGQKKAEVSRKKEIEKLIDSPIKQLNELRTEYKQADFNVTGEHIGQYVQDICASVDPRTRNTIKVRLTIQATVNALLDKVQVENPSKLNNRDPAGLSAVDIAVAANTVEVVELLLARGADPDVKVEYKSWYVQLLLRLDRVLKSQPVKKPLEMVSLTWIETERLEPEPMGQSKEEEDKSKSDGKLVQHSVRIPIELGQMVPGRPFENAENIQSAWFHVPSGKVITVMTIFRTIEGIVNYHTGDEELGSLFYFFRESLYSSTISSRSNLLVYRDPMYRVGSMGTHIKWKLSAVVFPCLVMEKLRSFERRRNLAERARVDPPSGFEDAYVEDVHIERTLDEACYPSLDQMTLDEKNKDQVLTREVPKEWEKAVKDKPILVVTQLWLWNLGNVLLSAYTGGEFPSTKKRHYDNDTDLFYNDVEAGAMMPNFYRLQPSLDLQIGLLIAECVEAFGQGYATGDPGISLSTLDIFEEAVVSKLRDVNRYLRDSRLQTRGISEQKEQEQTFIHSMSDIHSELRMIRSIISQQQDVLDKLLEDTKTERELVRAWKDQEATGWRHVERARTRLDEYVKRIDRIQADADRVEKTVDAMLNLKRTYASIEDARSSVIVGVAALAFAVITIVFTPLSFMASLFALPIDQIAQHQSNGNAPVFTTSYIGKWFKIVTLAVTAGIVYLSFFGYLRSKKGNASDTRDTSEAKDKPDVADATEEKRATKTRSPKFPWRKKAEKENDSKA